MGKKLKIHKAEESAEYILLWMSRRLCHVGKQLWGNLHSESVMQQHPDTAAERMVLPEEPFHR